MSHVARFGRVALLLAAFALGGLRCDSAAEEVPEGPLLPFAELLTPAQRQRADALISVFENDTPVLQYGYAERLDDGRGITAGRAGFTTGTGDAYLVVEQYASTKPSAPIAAYLPELRRLLTAADASDTRHLTGFEAAWAQAAQDAAFRAVQDAVVDSLYYRPALRHARTAGLTLPLAVMELYDAIIQHGEGDDPDGLAALIARTNAAAHGTPATGVDERAWLRAFLSVRRATLLNAHDPDTRAQWRESVGRVDIVAALEREGNVTLAGPLRIRSAEHTADIP